MAATLPLLLVPAEAPRWLQPCHGARLAASERGPARGWPMASVSCLALVPVTLWNTVYVCVCGGGGAGASAAGFWFNRRVLDGALNRVPDEFHEDVWRVLANTPGGQWRARARHGGGDHGCGTGATLTRAGGRRRGYGGAAVTGLAIGSHVWPSLPTTSEMTPGEYNFVLTCDAFLDHFHRPEERYVAVECLALAGRLHATLPEVCLRARTGPGQSRGRSPRRGGGAVLTQWLSAAATDAMPTQCRSRRGARPSSRSTC